MSKLAGFKVRHVPEIVGKRRLRRRFLAAQHGRCVLCGEMLVDPTWDHLIPASRNGSNEPINLALACNDCNGKRGDAMLTEEQRRRVRLWFGANKYSHVMNDTARLALLSEPTSGRRG